MHVHTHARTHTHTHACTHAHTRAHTHRHTRTHTHTHMHVHTHASARTHTHTVETHTHTHTHTCVHTHTYTHTHTHTLDSFIWNDQYYNTSIQILIKSICLKQHNTHCALATRRISRIYIIDILWVERQLLLHICRLPVPADTEQ